MKPNTISKRILAVVLTLALASSVLLAGCGSLSRILEEPEPPRTDAAPVELTNVIRTGDDYKGIEIFHGTWDEPYYSKDKKGYFYEERGWIYLHVEGDPTTRGYQHGWLLADYIQRSVDYNSAMLAELYAIDWQYFKSNAERMWIDKINEELKAELEGMVQGAAERGATFDYLDLLVLNGQEELLYSWFPTVQASYYQELAQGLWNPVGAGSNIEGAAEEAARDTGTEEATDENAGDTEEATGEADSQNSESSSSGSASSGSDPSGSSLEDTSSDSSSSGSASQESGETSGEKTKSTDEGTGSSEADDEEPGPLLQYSEQEALTGAPTNSNGVAATSNLTHNVLNGAYVKQASAFLATGAATEDGTLILAHNTIAAYTDSTFSNVMIDVKPKDGQRFTMQAAPGFVRSTAEVYSTESLLIANTLIKGFNVYSEEGAPEFLRIRLAAQYCETLDEFTEVMVAGNNGGLASSWLVGDLETNQIMELELGLSFYNDERITDGCFISFDGVDDTRILSFETDGSGYTDTRQSAGSRFVRLGDLVELYHGELTTDLAQSIIADHYDTYLKKSTADSRSICAHFDTDSAEYEPVPDVQPYMPYGTVDAKVMSSELAEENRILARWGSACGRAFDSAGFLEKNSQYSVLQDYLFDRPSQFWDRLYPLDAAK